MGALSDLSAGPPFGLDYSALGSFKLPTQTTLGGLALTTNLPAWLNVRSFGAVADGVTDDTAAITSAIAQAVANGGGVVFLTPGVYAIGSNTKYLTIYSGVAIVGYGATLKMTGGGCNLIFDSGVAGTRNACSNAEVVGLTIDAANMTSELGLNAIGAGAQTVTLQMRPAGVYVGARVLCDFGTANEEVVLVTAVSGVTFSGVFTKAHAANFVVGNPGGGCIWSAPPKQGDYSNLRVRDCTFLGIPADPVYGNYHAIALSSGSAIRIDSNYIPSCGGDAINCNAGQYIVTNNVVLQGDDGGVAFNNKAYGIIAGNYLKKCAGGIGCGPEGSQAAPYSTLLIDGNHIDTCANGIFLGWFGFALQESPCNVKIVGNTITNCWQTGLVFSGSASGNTIGLSVVGNTFDSMGSTAYNGTSPTGGLLGDGISLGNCPGFTITGNTFVNCASRGISLTGGSSLGCISGNLFRSCATVQAVPAIDIETGNDNVAVSGNSLYACGNRGIYTVANRTTITGNVIVSCVNETGIIVYTGATGCVVVGNTVVGNKYGISNYNVGAADSVIVGNVCTSNTTTQFTLAHAGLAHVASNAGLNPVVNGIAAPTFGASGVAVSNPTAIAATVWVVGGTISSVSINGTSNIPLTGGTFRVPPHGTITVNYTGSPTWLWLYD